MENLPDCPKEECRYYPECEMDKHHTYWPRREYTTPVEKRFRNLGANVVQMCMAEHQELHFQEQPPDKPSREIMLNAIREQR